MAVGAAGNVASDAIKGNIASMSDLAESALWGAGANALGYAAQKGISTLKVKKINNMTRAGQKNYLNNKVFRTSRANINKNLHIFMSSGTKAKINILEKSLRVYRSGIYSTFTSTFTGVFRQ